MYSLDDIIIYFADFCRRGVIYDSERTVTQLQYEIGQNIQDEKDFQAIVREDSLFK